MLRVVRPMVALVRPHVAPRFYRLHEAIARVSRRNCRTVVENVAGADPNMSSRCCAVLVHFDTRAELSDYVLVYLDQLRAAGWRTWLISNAPSLSRAAVEQAKPHVARILRRNNFGYDMGAYKDGIIDVIERAAPEQLVICNDSVYGPIRPLGPILERARSEAGDVWGMTDSHQISYHLQSYFILFNRRAIDHSAFGQFWCKLPYVDSRGWLIHNGEIGLSHAMLRAGLKVRALFPYEAVTAAFRNRIERSCPVQERNAKPVLEADARNKARFMSRLIECTSAGTPLNPTHSFWDVLIADLGFPFIKRDLLQKNPLRIPGLDAWPRLVGDIGDYDVELIHSHLAGL